MVEAIGVWVCTRLLGRFSCMIPSSVVEHVRFAAADVAFIVRRSLAKTRSKIIIMLAKRRCAMNNFGHLCCFAKSSRRTSLTFQKLFSARERNLNSQSPGPDVYYMSQSWPRLHLCHARKVLVRRALWQGKDAIRARLMVLPYGYGVNGALGGVRRRARGDGLCPLIC